MEYALQGQHFLSPHETRVDSYRPMNIPRRTLLTPIVERLSKDLSHEHDMGQILDAILTSKTPPKLDRAKALGSIQRQLFPMSNTSV